MFLGSAPIRCGDGFFFFLGGGGGDDVCWGQWRPMAQSSFILARDVYVYYMNTPLS